MGAIGEGEADQELGCTLDEHLAKISAMQMKQPCSFLFHMRASNLSNDALTHIGRGEF